MEMDLTLNQIRVIGCLLEKETTTPDQYPLSLNALTLACNQKSNREPVLNLTESEVQQAVDELRQKHLLREESGFGSRVVKYKHRFCNTEFGELQLSKQQRAILCVLFVRGPQTPGELRTRTNRLCKFDDVQQVEAVLEAMGQGDTNPLVCRLPREPGKREVRYAHCFGDTPIQATQPAAEVLAITQDAGADQDRIAALEQQVAELQQAVAAIQAQLQPERS